MTAQVDVLAVLVESRSLAAAMRDDASANNNEVLGASWESFRFDAERARAAVAELIEVGRRSIAHVERRAKLGAINADERADMDAFRAALARVGGAK